MTYNLPRKAIIAVTSANPTFWEDGKKTGLFYVEALHPYQELIKAGFEVDIVSETGSSYFDERSTTDQFLGEDKKIYEDASHPFNIHFNYRIYKAADINPKQYGLFFAAGGHGTLYDFPNATKLQAIAADIYKRGGIVAAVCHGPALLPSIKDKNGKPIIAGKNLTGFAADGEKQLSLVERMNNDNLLIIEQGYIKAGANYVAPPEPWGDFSMVDGRLVTGVNPSSAKSTAEKAIEAFESQMNVVESKSKRDSIATKFNKIMLSLRQKMSIYQRA